MMNVTGEDGQQENMGYVQFSSPQAAAAAQKVGLARTSSLASHASY
jgi:hypothetical protein